MLKKELEERVGELEQENAKLTERWEGFLSDLKEARLEMALQAATMQGSVQQCDLILRALSPESGEGDDPSPEES